MDEITTLVGRLVLPATITTVLVLVVVNVAKGRERPLREAVAKAQSHAATAAVWLALALVAFFGPLESIDRWGLWVTPALNAGPLLVGGAALAVVSIRRRSRKSNRSPAIDEEIPDDDDHLRVQANLPLPKAVDA